MSVYTANPLLQSTSTWTLLNRQTSRRQLFIARSPFLERYSLALIKCVLVVRFHAATKAYYRRKWEEFRQRWMPRLWQIYYGVARLKSESPLVSLNLTATASTVSAIKYDDVTLLSQLTTCNFILIFSPLDTSSLSINIELCCDIETSFHLFKLLIIRLPFTAQTWRHLPRFIIRISF